LAHSFEALAVAEGIENVDDLRALFKMGCDLGQGYLLVSLHPGETSGEIHCAGSNSRQGRRHQCRADMKSLAAGEHARIEEHVTAALLHGRLAPLTRAKSSS
jgi:EAL domain-containing protein (putative c-di-GMP-specific phosphodiesterase class I)